mmetsp:Transcript_14071/g.18492  ORF Transcript_14071/g.18492 Transcript_14071/m.18492 type:complete len:192 (+) Transcript_14071:63-638(+)|eukprot:CAMPEP_0195262702 /NCGR_PEP_ID=MMETSP0706-20130129/9901_1 /TAXON_ID=33640 /ORGANISM="Asterionellopsis glacialis, Strain CCMP134" /LENGTH=191 /DNA_ID=CAMNT_0040316811 /DNA_START=61 /DNA_END=636 /DNA_ORIENTATION=+
MGTSKIGAIAFAVVIACANAFVVPKSTFFTVDKASSLHALPLEFPATFASVLPSVTLSDGDLLNQAGETLKTVAIVVTGLVFGAAGLTYIFASFLIPKAAEQLERETKEMAPELWAEYEAKLEPGQVLAMRPDLMQELGNAMQPVIEQKIADAQANPQQPQSPVGQTEERPSSPTVVDAEVIDVDVKPTDK